jgi:long-chain fatty acid transport protein
MRKLLTLIAATLIAGNLLAGGLVTNTNQSAMFTRLQNRNASTGIDAVYYNPAGLTKLGNGFFASINNQTIGQTKTIATNYAPINGSPREYVGNVSAPIYPGVYVAYNTGNLSFSAGFNPVGGGGGATYDEGLPQFEYQISEIPALLSSQKIPTTAYEADIFFEGSSVYFGYQANVAYKINDQLSLGAGVRLVSAKNTYNGYIKNIQINPNYPAFGTKYNGVMNPASGFFTDGSTVLTQLSVGSTTAASGLNTAMAAGLPPATPLTALPPTQQAQIAVLLGAAGISTAGMNVGTAAATLTAVAPQYASKAATMSSYAAQTQDRSVDVEETGTGYTPIISANYSPSDKVNISLRYEFQTKLELTTKVNGGMDGGGLFVDGEKVIADMPALLAIGGEFKPMDKLLLGFTFNTYFDQNVDYDGSESVDIDMIDNNFYEYGLGAEYSFSDKFRASLGWVATSTGVNDNYQSDMRYSANTNSFGGGIGYRISPLIDLNLGGQYTLYQDATKDFTRALGAYTETYSKQTWIVALGLDFYFGKTE